MPIFYTEKLALLGRMACLFSKVMLFPRAQVLRAMTKKRLSTSHTHSFW